MVVAATTAAARSAGAFRAAASSSSSSGRVLLIGGAGRRRPRPSTAAAGRGPMQGRQQVRAFHVPMPWDGRRKAREDGELQLISRMEAVLAALDGPLSLAAGNPFRGLVEEKSARGVVENVEPPKKEEFQQWLTVAETELGLLAKAQLGVFAGGEWWVEGHTDKAAAAQALHTLRLQQLCGELKKSKAVFTPHLPGDRLLPGAVGRVVRLLQADMDGDLKGRLRASWALQDYGDPMQQQPLAAAASAAAGGEGTEADSPVQQSAMEDAVYTTLNPTVNVAAAWYPTLGGVTKAQKKAFAKFVRFYTRDQADFPTRLRCIFHWAERPLELALASPPPVPPLKVISFEEYLRTQQEHFPAMHEVGAGVPRLYKATREAAFHQKSEDRQTLRVGMLYLVGLGFADAFVSTL